MAYTPSLADLPQTQAPAAPQAGNQPPVEPVATTSPAPTPVAKGSYTPSLADIPGVAPTTLPSKLAAGATSMAKGAVEGIGQTLAAPVNLLASAMEEGLKIASKAGIVPDSMYQNTKANNAGMRQGMSQLGNAIENKVFPSDTVGAAAQQENPQISKYSNVAGNMLGSAATAGGMVGKLLPEANAVLSGAATQGAQGLLMGASANPEKPWTGGAAGATVGAIGGAVVGKLDRSAQIIADKIDDAERIGVPAMSEAGVKSIKGALDDSGKELTTEEVEKATKIAIQSKLDSVAPKVDISQPPTDMITNMATTRFPEMETAKNALYKPLNESTVPAVTPTLNTALSTITNKKAVELLPKSLQPNSQTLGDLMTYRKQIQGSIDQAQKAITMGTNTADFKTVQDLIKVKDSVTQDLNAAADKAGLAGQLQKADDFYKNEYSPFKVYNTTSGKLLSPEDITDTWTRVSKLLKPRLPNLTAMEQVAKTLGPEGKQVFGYAYLQQAVNRSMNVDGRIFPGKITQELNKLENTGLAAHILTPELKEAFEGMRNIAEGALKTTKMSSQAAPGLVMSFVNSLTHNSMGINLLRTLGSKTADPATLKNVIKQVLMNAAEKQSGSPTGPILKSK
jgi:hypothetical protein